MSDNKLATLAVLATVFFWGGSGSITKIALRELSPSILVTSRTLIAGLLLVIISKKIYGHVVLTKKDHKLLALCGFVGYSVYFLLESYGFSLITAANGTLILAAIPLFTVAIEVLWLKESISFNKGLGVLISMVGVGLVIGKSVSISGNSHEMLGTLFMLGAALSWAIYTIVAKGLNPEQPSVLLTAYQMLYGVIFMIPALLFEGVGSISISPITIGSVLYLALFCSALACFLFLIAIKGLGPSSTNVYLNLMPFVGIIVAYFVLGESLYPMQYIGGIVIVAGVFLVNYKGTQKAQVVIES
ncbi:DMT family transporter [Alkalicella caledoniensis]|uniref:DMT family transporter n=1 Tax=Alkalicella caledoniensis TaxID=2731377 RepID=A0A7G9WBL4_ALKCA|nr:DMT family transporter [Alkalicella caledoniensis]QNO16076.1 DMT family transporter [Alkalicella caledoniensis]